IVATELFDEDWTGGETLGTVVFTEVNGKTLLTQTILYASQAARDGALGTGMTSGMADSYAQLDDRLASLQHGAKGAA
ncbi:ATPase, partial [Mesorhizobium sp. M8A.F.Ca.ET.213.01.1.1]